MKRHTDFAVAFSDWEAGKKRRELRRKRREAKRPAAETPVTSSSISDRGFTEPWPGHNIVFDLDEARKKGYVASEQTVLSGVKGYTFFKEDGTGRFMRPEMLITLKLAHKM